MISARSARCATHVVGLAFIAECGACRNVPEPPAPSISAPVATSASQATALPAAAAPCARYRPSNTRVRWACLANGAPVDLVTIQSMLVTVLPSPVRVLLLDSEPLDPSIPVVDRKKPPVHVCVLDQPGAGFNGFVAFDALHDERCRR